LENISTHILIGLTTFAITNIDDLLILTVYFSNSAFKKSNVVIGQYLGVMALVAVSLSGLLLGNILEPQWIGLLGIIPIILGLKGIIELFKKDESNSDIIKTKSTIQFLNVALITIANGGDNIGIYTPLFASIDVNIAVIYIFIFMLMIAVWCVLAFYFVKHPLIKIYFSKYGHIILPFFLILLGSWILIESKTFSILF
jgi:cadmium resistance protein CadD (predicted permease)